MTTIAVPAPLPAEPEPQVQPGAAAVLTDVRAAATAASDVADWARANAAPEDFRGDAAEAAQHAATRFSVATGAVVAALGKGALAIDRFLAAMARRRSEHVDLMERRSNLNQAREALLSRIDRSTGDDTPALVADASGLHSRFADYEADLQAWRDRVTADEDAAIAALRSVDTLAEGRDQADRGDRVDTAALAARLRRLQADTDAVNAWWRSLSPAERNALLISDPDLVGNTDGIPADDRDEANRAAVQRDLEHLLGLQASGQELSASEQGWLENAQAIEQAIAHAEEIPYSELDIDVNVLAYQPHAFGGDGVAAVSYGDPDSADHTAVYVPGIMQDGTKIDENGLDALALYEQATADGSSVAAIAWIGYDSPNFDPASLWGLPDAAGDLAHTLTEANAEQGGQLLSAFVDGLNSSHGAGADGSHLTVIGHSYGSTTSAHSAADGLAADSLVLVGSPGAGGGVDHVSDLGMPAGQVYVGSAAHDPVTWLGGQDGLLPGSWDDGLGLGEDPAQSDFGAHTFPVADGTPFDGLDGLVDVGLLDNHVSYFEQGNPALENMAAVVTGHGHQVVDTGGRSQDAHDHLYGWVGAQVLEQWDKLPRPRFDDLWPDRWP